MKRILGKHKKLWTKENLISFVVSIVYFWIALVANKLANEYVLDIRWTAVGDILLSNLPSVPSIDNFIIKSSLFATFLIIVLLTVKPKYIIFATKSLALLIIIRSFFISLTHLWVNPEQVNFRQDLTGFWLYDILYNTQNDFFFSGHTSIPFMMALVFWKEKIRRIVFLITTLVFASSVIIAHIHYSIDVFAAPFITFSIYSLAKYFFKKDYELTEKH